MGTACVPDGAITLFFGATDTDSDTTVNPLIVTRMAMTRPLDLVPGEPAACTLRVIESKSFGLLIIVCDIVLLLDLDLVRWSYMHVQSGTSL